MIAGDDRGVTHALSFAIIFGLIVLSVGAVYLGGYGALTSQQESEQLANAERAFVGLKGAFDDVERGDGLARTSEIGLAGGSLSVDESSSINVTVDYNESDGSGLWNETLSMGSIAYEYEDETIAYESGAVIRRTGDGGLVREAPTMQCSADRLLVSVVEIEGSDDVETVSGDGTVEVKLDEEDRFLYSRNDPEGEYNVTVAFNESEYAEEWGGWFDDREGWTETSGGYTCDTDAVYVRQTTVTVRLVD